MPFSLKTLIPRKGISPKSSASSSSAKSSSPKKSLFFNSTSDSNPTTNRRTMNPFAATTPTRRPGDLSDAAPPPYSPSENSATIPVLMHLTGDSPYSFLTQFDTIFLIDDSGSMAGRSWRETAAALSAITPICTAHDADGIDIYFLNHRNPENPAGGYTNIKTIGGVERIFNSVKPLGGTPTGTRLQKILKPYLARVEESIVCQAHGQEATVKPLNIIVVTDGVPTDDVESTIIQAAKKLDALGGEPWQVGIQFFQVGCQPDAAEHLRELDDALSPKHGIRDMVDTVPWSDGQELTPDGILKVVVGSLIRRIDRRPGSDERLRRRL